MILYLIYSRISLSIFHNSRAFLTSSIFVTNPNLKLEMHILLFTSTHILCIIKLFKSILGPEQQVFSC